jgi:hypothetical protein
VIKYLCIAINDFTCARVAEDLVETCDLVEAGFEYVTAEYHDGSKVFRKRK